MCLHAPLYAPLCASLNPPQTPTPSQGGTSDSNGRVNRNLSVIAISLPDISPNLSIRKHLIDNIGMHPKQWRMHSKQWLQLGALNSG